MQPLEGCAEIIGYIGFDRHLQGRDQCPAQGHGIFVRPDWLIKLGEEAHEFTGRVLDRAWASVKELQLSHHNMGMQYIMGFLFTVF